MGFYGDNYGANYAKTEVAVTAKHGKPLLFAPPRLRAGRIYETVNLFVQIKRQFSITISMPIITFRELVNIALLNSRIYRETQHIAKLGIFALNVTKPLNIVEKYVTKHICSMAYVTENVLTETRNIGVKYDRKVRLHVTLQDDMQYILQILKMVNV